MMVASCFVITINSLTTNDMNKQDAKRAATIAAATTVGSAGGTIGAGSIINNTSYEESLADQNNSMDTEDNHTSLETPHIYHSSEEITQDGIVNGNDGHSQLDESSDSSDVNQTANVETEPVNPNPEIIVDPIEDNNFMVMYGGPVDPEPIVQIEPDMYGGPTDCIYDPEDDVTGIITDEEDVSFVGDTEQIPDDISNNTGLSELDDIDYMS